MYKYILISILLLFTVCPTNSTAETTSVAFINGNPGVTMLGLAKFIVDDAGKLVDYEVLNIHWTDEKKVIHLEPGVYGVTQYAPKINAIVSFQIIVVGNDPILVKFRRL